MRKVFNNSMVAHVWAQQSQPEGRSANAQFYFAGDTIFSYGAHYPAARFTDAVWNGARAVLMNCENYSVTTQRHLRIIRGALRGLNVKIFDVPRVTEHLNLGYADAHVLHTANAEHYVREFENIAKECANPRKRMWHNGSWADTADARCDRMMEACCSLSEYVEAFGLALPDIGFRAKERAIRAAFAKYNDPTAGTKRERAAAKRTAKREAEHFALIARARAYIEGVGPRLTYDEQVTLRRVNRSIHADYISADTTVSVQSVEKPSVTPAQWQDGLGDANAFGDSYHWGDPTLVRPHCVLKHHN